MGMFFVCDEKFSLLSNKLNNNRQITTFFPKLWLDFLFKN